MRRTKGKAVSMDNGQVLKNYFTWCVAQSWDWMIGAVSPRNSTIGEMNRNFHKLIGEIESSDATDNFRWVRFISHPNKENVLEFDLLVGGLRGGDWERWAKRWVAINEHKPGAKAGWEYSFARNGSRLGPTLKQLIRGKRFDIEMRLGLSNSSQT